MLRPAAMLFALGATPAVAVTCEDIDHLGQSFTICRVDPATEDLRLFLRDQTGEVLGSFQAVETQMERPLLFAMNAGMYHDDRSPVGLYIENGVQEMRVVETAGPGNFGMLPNGILCIQDGAAMIIETQRYLDDAPHCTDATQSGPMLVLDGKLHPRLIPGGTSKYYRNGVGQNGRSGPLFFAISNQPVNFHDFATLFRDRLGLENALFFDGKISRLFAPELGRDDFGWPMGPIVGVLAPVDGAGAND